MSPAKPRITRLFQAAGDIAGYLPPAVLKQPSLATNERQNAQAALRRPGAETPELD
jgi:hypothetical protein